MNEIIKDGKKITLQVDKGRISFLMIAGEDTVRNIMSFDGAVRMIRGGQVTDGSKVHPHHPVCVDGKYFFPGTMEEVDPNFLNAVEAPPTPEVKPIMRKPPKPQRTLGKKRR